MADAAIQKPKETTAVTVNGVQKTGTDSHTKADKGAIVDSVYEEDMKASAHRESLKRPQGKAAGSSAVANTAVDTTAVKRRRISEDPTRYSASHAEQLHNTSSAQASMPSTIPASIPSPSPASTMTSQETGCTQQSVAIVQQQDVPHNHHIPIPSSSTIYGGLMSIPSIQQDVGPLSQISPSRRPSQAPVTQSSSETLQNAPYNTQLSQQTLQHDSINNLSQNVLKQTGLPARVEPLVAANYSTNWGTYTGTHSHDTMTTNTLDALSYDDDLSELGASGFTVESMEDDGEQRLIEEFGD